ncbi:GTP cyclohydrolase II [Aestuariivita boseongensis]|uniref:GTP cyclohydrolase II n=1 Tax=Aestuariivita boseongensis TaxID=1470562 RepID=UPI000680DCF5|nr:GTP cyclohydrolase II [Aestuariivita boseongensis]
MPLTPDMTELLARARGDLRTGLPVVLSGKGGAVLAAAAETVSPARLEQMGAAGDDLVLTVTARRAETLKARAYDGDLARIVPPRDAGFDWFVSTADPADDLNAPMKGPMQTRREGPADLHRMAITLMKSARLLPAAIVVNVADPAAFAGASGLTLIDAAQAKPLLDARSVLRDIVNARLPMEVSETGRLHVFRPDDGGEEHYAIEIGRPDRSQPVLARLHSACFTGDLMGSLKCDCGPQLRGALAQMGAEGAGVLLYLNQEGRGIGLANKMRAYSLQDQGFDTVEANHRLGFEDDERDFRLGSDILKTMGFSSVRLLTNNPAKIDIMERNGIQVVERVPLKVGETAHNRQYLATKAAKSGHML